MRVMTRVCGDGYWCSGAWHLCNVGDEKDGQSGCVIFWRWWLWWVLCSVGRRSLIRGVLLVVQMDAMAFKSFTVVVITLIRLLKPFQSPSSLQPHPHNIIAKADMQPGYQVCCMLWSMAERNAIGTKNSTWTCWWHSWICSYCLSCWWRWCLHHGSSKHGLMTAQRWIWHATRTPQKKKNNLMHQYTQQMLVHTLTIIARSSQQQNWCGAASQEQKFRKGSSKPSWTTCALHWQ